MKWAAPALFVLCVLVAACGGGAEPAQAPSASAHDPDAPESNHDDSNADDAPAEEEAAGPRAGACDDGTCSPCGSGICPTGWYCDESASGGPACGWLPACAQKASCGCLTAKLGSACKCSEQSGALHVTCK